MRTVSILAAAMIALGASAFAPAASSKSFDKEVAAEARGVVEVSNTSGSVESRIYDYVNPAAFSIAPQGTFGNVGRTIPVYGPGEKNWDLSVFKSVTFKERFKAQFRCEALNAFNSPMFYSPNTTVGRTITRVRTSGASACQDLKTSSAWYLVRP